MLKWIYCTAAVIMTSVVTADNPKTPEEIEVWWNSGRTLPLETTALYPLNDQKVKNDTGINVLIDMSHKCDFFSLWWQWRHLNALGFRTVNTHATLDSVLADNSSSRVRIPVANKVHPFAMWKNPEFNVVLTEGAVSYPDYIPEERKAVMEFVKAGGGLVISGSSIKDKEVAKGWSLNLMMAEYGAVVREGTEKYNGGRYPKLQTTDEWEVVLKGDGGAPIYARRTFGQGRIVFLASSSLYRFDKNNKEDIAAKCGFLSDAFKWAAAGKKPVGGDKRFPVAFGGGGGIYPESQVNLPGIVCYYSKNQTQELVETVKSDFPKITDDIYAWLPSKKPEQPMYLILCSGNGGGWAVNAYLPKEASTISTEPSGIRSIFAHEQAHTMAGPCNAANHPFGGNQGEEHAGWFQGKIIAKYNGAKGPNRGCQNVFVKNYDGTQKTPEEKFNKKNLEPWTTGWERMMIWYAWQKFDDRYGTTWYPRWRWVQGERWKDDPKRKLTWEESIEDMSIAVGEDLFPFFKATGKELSRERFEKAEFMGQTINLPIAPIQATPPGDVCLDPIGDYKKPIVVKRF
ncbi:MAG: hypothetical protein PHO37_01160 [Kiritimatiellae bacterium]|nr:hypothetical protein [Kiritimatiellia bacterium]